MDRWIGAFLPGAPQLLRRKRLEGGTALVLWVVLLALMTYRIDRVTASIRGGVDEWVALLTLVGILVGIWCWSWMERNRESGGKPSGTLSPGHPTVHVWRRLRRNRLAVLGLGIVVVFYLAMILTPFIAPFGPEYREAYALGGDMSLRLAHPTSVHIMGTDQFSQDVFSRILYGARISLIIGLLAIGVSVTLGTLLGAVAGYWGGWTDMVIMRLVDMVMAFPRLVLLIVMVALFRANIFVVIVALAFTQWPFTARMVRGEILAMKEREFAEAARALGFSRRRILLRHLLPNAMGPLIVVATLGIGNAIVLEAGLSFLNLGVRSSSPSWGAMVNAGRDHLLDAWWVATFPALAIVLVVLAFNLVGDGLRDALDPRQGDGGGR